MCTNIGTMYIFAAAINKIEGAALVESQVFAGFSLSKVFRDTGSCICIILYIYTDTQNEGRELEVGSSKRDGNLAVSARCVPN